MHRTIGKIDFQAIHLECEAEERRRFSSEPDEERAKRVHFRRLSPSTIQTRWLRWRDIICQQDNWASLRSERSHYSILPRCDNADTNIDDLREYTTWFTGSQKATASLYKTLHNLRLREKATNHEISIDELPDSFSTSWLGGKPLLSFVDLESLKTPTAQLISAYFLYRQEERWHDRADERKAQASKANQARQITNANKSREQREMVKARTGQGFQQYWANLSAAQRALRVKKQSDYKRKYNASLDPDERAAITKRQLRSRKENDAQRAPEEVYRRNQEHLWTIGWSFASRHLDTMLRIDALEREGKYQALTQVALEDVCDSSWKGGHNPARMSRDQCIVKSVSL